MGNYSKNKNFIPRNYIKNVDLVKNKGSKRGVVILIIINLLMLPLSIDLLLESKEPEVKEVPKVVEEGINIKSVTKWIEEVDGEVLSMDIRNNSGTIIVKSMEKVYELEERPGVVISKISSTDTNNYNLQVTRNN
ncbi:MAG: hypothetical protein ACRDA5_02830 [Clostridium sp.]